MRLQETQKATLAATLILALLGILAGALLIVVPTDFLLKVVFIIMGVLTVISNIPGLTVGIMSANTRFGLLSLILSLISIVIGFLMIFWHAGVLMVILGVYMIVFPILEICMAKDKLSQLRTELPKLIIGVVLLLIGPSRTLDVVFDIAGWGIIVLTAVGVIAVCIGQKKLEKKKGQVTGNRIFADTTGDGKIDTVYVDLDGDGKPDTSSDYREKK